MSRIVNRVPLLREPSRARHHYRSYNGPTRTSSRSPSLAGYDPDFWQIPDDPFDATAWLTATKETQQ